MCGIWGTLSLGLFACGQYGATGPLAADNSAPLKGLLYGGGFKLLEAQAIGSACVTLATFSVAMAVMLLLNATGTLRLPREAELYGMDLHEHGISAYPEYVISALGAPSGMTQDLPEPQPAASSVAALNPLSRAIS
jgi:Amt family ammonium transporter